MALSPPSQFSGYAPGSIAARPTVQKGGMRGKNEDPAAFRARMDARKPMAIAPGGQTRQDRVIASRMDGTFEAKRNTFNAANANVQMDEAGNIGPKAAAPPVNPVPPVNTVTPPASQASPAPAAPSIAPTLTAGIAGGPVAAGMAQVAGKALAMQPRKPATFEGMPMEQFKTGHTIERPTTSANPTARRSPGGGFVMPPQAQQPTVTPPSVTAGVTPPVTRNAPVTPSVTPRAVTPLSPTESNQFTALGQAMQLSQATQGPMPRPYASTPAPATASTAPPGGFSPEFHRRFAPATPAAPPPSPPAAAPAPPTAVAPTGAKPKTLAELKTAAEASKAARQPGLVKVGNAISSGASQASEAIKSGASQFAQGGSKLAQTLNTQVPQLAGSVAGAIDTAGKTALSTLDNTLTPARNWLAGSDQKSPEELAYEEALAAEQKKKQPKPPGVPAVTPRPDSSAPQPFSAAALGTAKPRAVMPPSIAMLGR